jgi:hypothetical protein
MKMPTSYEAPDNLVTHLDNVVDSAAQTSFFGSVLAGRSGVESLADFASIPFTPIEMYRRQRLADLLAQPASVDSIVGPYRGLSPDSVAITESSAEGAERFDIFTDAVQECLSLDARRTCAVVASADKRYFGAEIATILIRSGVVAHVFVDHGGPRTYERLRLIKPDILVVLTAPIVEAELPSSIKLCITFGLSQRFERVPQLDLYVVSELGFLGHSTEGDGYVLYKDSYHFETSESGRLVVTSLFNRVQPLLRIETSDYAGALDGDFVRLRHRGLGMC